MEQFFVQCMKAIILNYFLCIVAFFANPLVAQISSLLCFRVGSDSIIQLKDDHWLDPSSIRVFPSGKPDQIINCQYDSVLHRLRFSLKSTSDSLQICYRVFPFRLGHRLFIYDSSLRQNALTPDYAKPGKQVSRNSDWWETPGIRYSGNFNRGLSTGNNQSVVLNSSLQLQLSGELGQGIRIEGALSDQQIPIQPEGNTRQIQEFDRLYLRISKGKTQLTGGDFELTRPAGYFINYLKKNKGGMFESQIKWKGWNIQQKSALAITKGKTQRLNLAIQNGNQGPYRLQGLDGENFIIVLAGSEKVFLDGMLLERGENSDYIIDYNLAEIRFMPSRLVTDQSRIVIEFEYIVQTYTRSLWMHQNSWNKQNWNVYTNVFQEKDSKEPSIASDLDSLDRSLLSDAGDDLRLAVRSGIRKASTDFNLNRVYYRQRDTAVVIAGQLTNLSYLYYDPLADSSALQVQFSEVGNGRGHYMLKQSSANGRVYEWVAPDPHTGNPKGQYEPLVQLIPPTNHWMLSGGLQYRSPKGFEFSAESAFSSFDLNRFSNSGDEDNRAAALQIKAKSPYGYLWDSIVQMRAGFSYEWVHQHFKPVLNFRPVEFERDWNLNGVSRGTDRLPEAFAEINVWQKMRLHYRYSHLDRSEHYSGQRHLAEGSWAGKLTNVSIVFQEMSSDNQNLQYKFSRPKFEWKRHFATNWSLEALALRERNAIRFKQTDSLQPSSFSFDVYQLRASQKSSSNKQTGLYVKMRRDWHPLHNAFALFSDAYELGLDAYLRETKSGHWDVKFAGRTVRYEETALHDSLSAFHFIGAIDHQLKLAKQCIVLKNYYELQSGAEPRQEFVFEERKPGEGHYIYIDFNKDGIRQNVEYVYAPEIDTARFERYQLFNSSYYQIYQAAWNQTLSVDFSRYKTGKPSFKEWVRSLSLESSMRFSSKLDEASAIAERFNPLQFLKGALAYNASIRQTIYFNRNDPVFETQIAWISTQQKQLLISGEDEKSSSDPHVKIRRTLGSRLDILLESHLKTEKRLSNYFSEQNYHTQQWTWSPGLVFRVKSNLRLFVNLTNVQVDDLENQISLAKWVEGETGFASLLKKKITLRGQMRYVRVNYQGDENSLAAYQLLQGFRSGDNFSWEVLMEYKISSVLQLQFSYHARKSAGDDVLHTGRAQLRAYF